MYPAVPGPHLCSDIFECELRAGHNWVVKIFLVSESCQAMKRGTVSNEPSAPLIALCCSSVTKVVGFIIGYLAPKKWSFKLGAHLGHVTASSIILQQGVFNMNDH